MKTRSVSISTFKPPRSYLTFSSRETTGLPLRAYNIFLGRKAGKPCSVLTRCTTMAQKKEVFDRYPATFLAVTLTSNSAYSFKSVSLIRTSISQPPVCLRWTFGVHDPARHPEDTWSIRLSSIVNPVSCGTTCIPSQSLSDRFPCRIDTHCQTLPIPLTHHRL
jgi:hypothetical protein